MKRKTHALIDLSAIDHNYHLLANSVEGSQTMPVIKADAYGHGALAVARRLSSQADAFAVAFIDEAIALRDAGIQQPCLLLEGVFTQDALPYCVAHNFWPMLHTREQLIWWLAAAEDERPPLWIKVDTGMHRLGLSLSQVETVLRQNPVMGDKRTTICTHLHSADDVNSSSSNAQIEQIRRLAERYNCSLSIANSAAIQFWPRGHAQWNRLGISLYGISALERGIQTSTTVELRPAMRLESSIIGLRDITPGESVGYRAAWTAKRPSRIATVAIGYADGYPRHAGNRAWVSVNGQLAPVVGRVSMDMIGVDVSHCGKVNLHDSVVLWGDQNLSVDRVADDCETIAYELVTRVSARVPREYLSND